MAFFLKNPPIEPFYDGKVIYPEEMKWSGEPHSSDLILSANPVQLEKREWEWRDEGRIGITREALEDGFFGRAHCMSIPAQEPLKKGDFVYLNADGKVAGINDMRGRPRMDANIIGVIEDFDYLTDTAIVRMK